MSETLFLFSDQSLRTNPTMTSSKQHLRIIIINNDRVTTRCRCLNLFAVIFLPCLHLKSTVNVCIHMHRSWSLSRHAVWPSNSSVAPNLRRTSPSARRHRTAAGRPHVRLPACFGDGATKTVRQSINPAVRTNEGEDVDASQDEQRPPNSCSAEHCWCSDDLINPVGYLVVRLYVAYISIAGYRSMQAKESCSVFAASMACSDIWRSWWDT